MAETEQPEPIVIPEELLPLPDDVDEADVTGIIYDGDKPVGLTITKVWEE